MLHCVAASCNPVRSTVNTLAGLGVTMVLTFLLRPSLLFSSLTYTFHPFPAVSSLFSILLSLFFLSGGSMPQTRDRLRERCESCCCLDSVL